MNKNLTNRQTNIGLRDWLRHHSSSETSSKLMDLSLWIPGWGQYSGPHPLRTQHFNFIYWHVTVAGNAKIAGLDIVGPVWQFNLAWLFPPIITSCIKPTLTFATFSRWTVSVIRFLAYFLRLTSITSQIRPVRSPAMSNPVKPVLYNVQSCNFSRTMWRFEWVSKVKLDTL